MENRLSLYTDIFISHRDIFIRDGLTVQIRISLTKKWYLYYTVFYLCEKGGRLQSIVISFISNPVRFFVPHRDWGFGFVRA